MHLSRAKASSGSICKLSAGNHNQRLQRAGHEPVCLVPEWTVACQYLRGLFESALTQILRAFYSADIGINTAPTCHGSICFVPELVAGSAAISLQTIDISSASDLFTADSLQCVSTQPALVVAQNFLHAYKNPFMPTDTFCSGTFYVHTDPDSLPSFAEECSFGN